MKILGIITARGGSKRVPGKNIKDFLGKPLIGWSIDVGKEANVFDRFILSSEDENIIKIGKESGIEVPFVRPQEFAEDTSSSLSVIEHALKWLKENEDYIPDWVVLLESSSPGRQVSHIREVVAKIEEVDQIFDSIIGISKIQPHLSPYKALILNDDDITSLEGKGINSLVKRNQDVKETYYINSAIYAFKANNVLNTKPSLWGDRTYGYLMDEKYALDIDTPEDWAIAEFKMKRILEENNI